LNLFLDTPWEIPFERKMSLWKYCY
jgi:hypothetical protein